MLRSRSDGTGSLCGLSWWGLKFSTTGPDIGLSDGDLLAGCRSESPGVKYATYEMKVENWNMGTLIDRPATEPG